MLSIHRYIFRSLQRCDKPQVVSQSTMSRRSERRSKIKLDQACQSANMISATENLCWAELECGTLRHTRYLSHHLASSCFESVDLCFGDAGLEFE